MNNKSQHGQTLVEVVVSIFVISLILIALMSAVNFSLTNTQYAKNKAIATKYAQEAVEWLRSERDSSWNTFYNRSSIAGRTYCVKSVPSWPMTEGVCNSGDYINNTYFLRQIVLTRSGADKVLINVNISWSQGSRTPSINIGTFLTKWE